MTGILLDAARNGWIEKLLVALNTGTEVDCVDDQGRTSLMLAAKHGQVDAVRVLLESKADVNRMATFYGWTALAYAANAGHTEVVRLLLEHGADWNLKAKRGKTPLVLAADRGHAEVVAILLEFGIEPDPAPDHHGWTPLRRAAKHGHTEVVRLLLHAGANAERTDYWGVRPLDIAIQNHHTDAVAAMQQANKEGAYGR